MAYNVLLMSMISQWLYIRSIRDLRASQVSALLYTQPVFTALMAVAALGELPTPLTVVSGALILVGVLLVNRPIGRRQATVPSRAARPSPASPR